MSTWAKWVIRAYGTWAAYGKADSEEYPHGEGPYTITDKWKDENGDIWYKMKWTNELGFGSGYGLLHISDSGSKMEAAYDMADFPTEIDPAKSWFSYGGIHHRQ